MIREAKRTLTGRLTGGEPDIRHGDHANGSPAVTIDLRGWNDTRTWDDPVALQKFGHEVLRAAYWLHRGEGSA